MEVFGPEAGEHQDFFAELEDAGKVNFDDSQRMDFLGICAYAIRSQHNAPILKEKYLRAKRSVREIQMHVDRLTREVHALHDIAGPDDSKVANIFHVWRRLNIGMADPGRGVPDLFPVDRLVGNLERFEACCSDLEADLVTRFGARGGRVKERPRAYLIWELAGVYERAGGRPSADWNRATNKPTGRFAYLLAQLRPLLLRGLKAESQRAFIEFAKSILAKRRKAARSQAAADATGNPSHESDE